MLPLAEMVSNREVKALAAVIESKIPTANVQELKMYVFAYRAIRWQTQDADSQPQFKETSNKLTDLIISSMDLPDSQEKRYIQKTYEKYRKLSCTKP